MCLRPLGFIRGCLRDVGFPRRLWWTLPVVKTVAALGLLTGVWVPPLAVLTAAALVVFFLVAVAAHVRAHDLGRNLFLNATGMLLISAAVLAFTLVAG